MNLLRKIKSIIQKDAFEADMAEEMRQHLELREQAHLAAGMSPQEARYAAQRSFGGVEQLKELARDARGGRWIENLIQDIRYGVRKLRRNSRFTCVVGLTLAVCIGVNTVVFTFYNAVVLKTLAVPAPHELVRLIGIDGKRPESRFTFSQYEAVASSASTLSAVLAVSSPETVSMEFTDSLRSKRGIVSIRVGSENFFSALGVLPARGRFFAPGKADGAVLSDDFWKRQFASDPSIVGKALKIEGVPVVVLGIAPSEFAGTGLPAQAPDLWLPLALQTSIMPKSDWFHGERRWQILARRKPSVSLEEVTAELRSLTRDQPADDGAAQRQLLVKPATLFPTDAGEFQSFKTIALIVMIAVGALLVIGCVNVVNMLEARNAARSHELAVRHALGASKTRLIQQLCTESALLGIIGGAGGILLSLWFSEIARVWIVETFRRLSGAAQSVFINVTPDWRVFIYTTSLSLFTGVLVGIWPAYRTTHRNLGDALKEAMETAETCSAMPRRKRNFLLGFQVAASLAMLVTAGLLFRGTIQSHRVDPGFEVGHLAVVNIDLQNMTPDPADRSKMLGAMVDRLVKLPGLSSLAWADHPPFMGHRFTTYTDQKHRKQTWAINGVSGDYFDTVGLPLLTGRTFTSEEVAHAAPVAVINETAAQHLWPNKSALGERLTIPGLPPLTIVGIAKSGSTVLMTKPDGSNLYYPKPIAAGGVAIFVRFRENPKTNLESLVSTIASVDEEIARQTYVVTLQDGPIRVQQLMSEAPAVIAATLGVIALILASAGVYGVVSFGVAQRKREIGIRMALGAQAGDVIRLILRQILQPIAWGVAAGLLGAGGISILFKRLLSNPEIPDLTYAAGGFPTAIFFSALGALMTMVLLAAMPPVRRATNMDPMEVLRGE